MRIAVIHSYYRASAPSGENLMVDEQVALLRMRGHDVHVVAESSETRDWSLLEKGAAGIRVATWHGADPLPALQEIRPDIVHVHNLFPNFGHDWLEHWRGPIVATLHNYRSACANGLLFRDGRICIECPSRGSWSAVRHGCYRDSRLASLPLAVRNRHGVAADRLLCRADVVVCLAEQAKQVMEGFGLSESKGRVVPNGIDVPHPGTLWARSGSSTGVVVGRLSSEKGILDLLRDWPKEMALDVIGTGPLEEAARAIAGPKVRLLGHLDRSTVLDSLPGYSFMVNASRCYEMQNTAVIEALGSGVPVIAWRETSSASMIDSRGCGATYRDRGSLHVSIEQVLAAGTGMRQTARSLYEERFTSSSWVQAIEEAYREAAALNQRRSL